MILEIVKTNFIEVSYDDEKNRATISVSGFWMEECLGNQYLEALKKLVQIVKPHFTLITDARELKTIRKSVRNNQLEEHELLVKAEISASTTVLPVHEFARYQYLQMLQDDDITCHKFDTLEEAEKWLDTQNTLDATNKVENEKVKPKKTNKLSLPRFILFLFSVWLTK